jgi:hypothetical protein
MLRFLANMERSKLRVVQAANIFGRSFSRREYPRIRSPWIVPTASAGAIAMGMSMLYGPTLLEIKDDTLICGEALIRGLRTLNAAIIITIDYKMNLPNKPHDSEEYISAISGCHRSLPFH